MRAKVVKSAIPPWVIQPLLPLITPEAVGGGRVPEDAASDGHRRTNRQAPTVRPAEHVSSHRCFCSSVPNAVERMAGKEAVATRRSERPVLRTCRYTASYRLPYSSGWRTAITPLASVAKHAIEEH